MFKFSLIILFTFMCLSSFSFAKGDDAKLQKEFGKDLTKAPFFLRFDFKRKFNKDWEKTYYSERKAFLEKYEVELAADQAREDAEAKAEAEDEKERLRQQKEALRQEKEELKAEAAEAKAQKQENDQRQKDFNNDIKYQEKELNKPSGMN